MLINDYRWRHGTEAWTLGYNAYRRYVVNHEVGHWLGLGHVSYCGKGETLVAAARSQNGLDFERNGEVLSEMVATLELR